LTAETGTAFGIAAKALAGKINPANPQKIDRTLCQLHNGGQSRIVGCPKDFTRMVTSLSSVKFKMTAPALARSPMSVPFSAHNKGPKLRMHFTVSSAVMRPLQ
jgi:hypothetical protein